LQGLYHELSGIPIQKQELLEKYLFVEYLLSNNHYLWCISVILIALEYETWFFKASIICIDVSTSGNEYKHSGNQS